ncbi:MAG: 3-hydroxyacyl-CoA dehydrogenase NAD-binding domain-containing protein [Marinovum sp.]|nr:3-hydroxyacyl-CoA dehydrogenase NAD-binding domain-containing protein [Marinovum sp.]
MVVSVTHQGAIAIVTIDNPPINATGQAIRQRLMDAIATTEADDSLRAVVLICAGRTFIAGADVREFDKPPQEPHLPDVLNAIEGASLTWVAAIHGTAFGGGLETALACDYRVAVPTARLGLPEVTLGLIPGAGGSVRLPRLVDADLALRMVVTGKPIGAWEGYEAGLIDHLAEGDLLEAALGFAIATQPDRKHTVKTPSDWAVFETQAAKILAKAKGPNAPKAAVQVLRNAYEMRAADAFAAERTAFLTLRDDPQSQALRYIFFAERGTLKIDRLKEVIAKNLSEIGVIGGGTMGAGIAAACLLAGFSVRMVERDAQAAEAGAARVVKILEGSLKRGLIGKDKFDGLAAKFAAADDYDSLSNSDLIIEAVFEDMNVKRQVFALLDATAKPDAILATNTSYLDVAQIAKITRDPSRVIGLHFFSPAHIMKLLEIVVPEGLADTVLATACAFAKALKKIPVLAGVCDGFIANRIMSAYRREAEFMIEDGAMPWDVDRAMLDFGLPMGVFAMGDLAGLDISWAMRKRHAATRDPSQRYVDIGDKLCEMGRFGRKTGRGYYLYQDGKTGVPDPEVEALILAEAARKGITRRPFSDDQIMACILTAMQSEGQAILEEGIAQSAADIDVVMVNAYGFPRWHGGPMRMAGG